MFSTIDNTEIYLKLIKPWYFYGPPQQIWKAFSNSLLRRTDLFQRQDEINKIFHWHAHTSQKCSPETNHFEFPRQRTTHLRACLSREKIKNPALVKNYIFSPEIQLGTYTYLYSFESSMKWPFPDIFSFGVNKNLRLQNHAEPTRCKKISSKPWLRSDISL